jgi:hypothetical protein
VERVEKRRHDPMSVLPAFGIPIGSAGLIRLGIVMT